MSARALSSDLAEQLRHSPLEPGPRPSPREAVALLERILDVLFPGYFGDPPADLEAHLRELEERLGRQIALCDSDPWLSRDFLEFLPELRRRLLLDARAALEWDPAATSLDEVILAYPGFLAIAVYRIAHRLHQLGVPTLPRILSEWAHSRTGADIHPGAEIGESFFLDHATGTVIGQTARVGDRVRLYQGVTLGALSFTRERPRHPTLEDDVVVYAHATVLGGRTVVGQGSVVGGSVFLTKSVPPGRLVAQEPPNLRLLARPRGSGPGGEFLPGDVDFAI